MPKPEVWYILPSANPDLCAQNLPAWRERGYRVALLQDRVRFEPSRESGVEAIVTRDRYPGWTSSINVLFREAVPENVQVVVAGGDDMLPDADHTASELAEQFLEHFGSSFGVMQPIGDEFEQTRTICGSPWLGRSWMESMYGGTGGMCEAYHQAFGDDELAWVARCMHSLWMRPDLTQYHDHFRRRGDAAPAYWVESAAAHDRGDCLTFIARAHAGFPGAEPLPGSMVPRQQMDLDVFRREYDGKAEQLWSERHAGDANNEASDRMARALALCAQRGLWRVAIYGAGQHTRRTGSALCTPPVEIVCVIDDDSERIGTRLWNYPIISMRGAIEQTHAIDAVVLSSDSMEDRLRDGASRLAAKGIAIVGLYGSGVGIEGSVVREASGERRTA